MFGKFVCGADHLVLRFCAARSTDQKRPLHLREAFNDGLGVDGIVGYHIGKIRSLFGFQGYFLVSRAFRGANFAFLDSSLQVEQTQGVNL